MFSSIAAKIIATFNKIIMITILVRCLVLYWAASTYKQLEGHYLMMRTQRSLITNLVVAYIAKSNISGASYI